MKVESKNIVINLSDGEEIIYIAEKNKPYFYFFILFPLLLVFMFIYYPYKYVFLNFNLSLFLQNFQIILPLLGCAAIVSYCGYIIYEYIIDFFFTTITLTSQKIILLIKNNPIFIDYEDIKFVSDLGPGGPSGIFIKTLKKTYSVYFVDCEIIKSKIKEVNNNKDFDELKLTKKELFWVIIAIILFIIAKIFI